jgi:hypothetical protein
MRIPPKVVIKQLLDVDTVPHHRYYLQWLVDELSKSKMDILSVIVAVIDGLPIDSTMFEVPELHGSVSDVKIDSYHVEVTLPDGTMYTFKPNRVWYAFDENDKIPFASLVLIEVKTQTGHRYVLAGGKTVIEFGTTNPIVKFFTRLSSRDEILPLAQLSTGEMINVYSYGNNVE